MPSEDTEYELSAARQPRRDGISSRLFVHSELGRAVTSQDAPENPSSFRWETHQTRGEVSETPM